MNAVVSLEPPTEPIHVPTAAPARQAPAVLWARAHGVYVALAVTIALAVTLSPLPRFESIVAGIATTNAALWLLRKLGGR